MSSADFFHTQDIFESFFGFNPKNGETNFSGVNKDVKPMKTNEAFEKIFGKRYHADPIEMLSYRSSAW